MKGAVMAAQRSTDPRQRAGGRRRLRRAPLALAALLALLVLCGLCAAAAPAPAGASVFTPFAATVAAPSITVTAPTGTTTYAQGSLLTVSWTTSPAAAAGEFGLWARSASGGWYGGQLVAASGLAAYSTTLTLDVPPGSGYQAIVAWRPTAGSGDWVSSGTSPGSFTVTRRPPPPQGAAPPK